MAAPTIKQPAIGARVGRVALSALIAATLCVPGLATTREAFADKSTEAEMTAAQKAVEESGAAYDEAEEAYEKAQSKADKAKDKADEAQAEVDKIDAKIDKNNKRISELNEEIPKQEAESDDSLRVLYRMSQNQAGLLEMFLGAETPAQFLKSIEYMNRIQAKNMAVVTKLAKLKGELQDVQDELNDDMAEAEKAQDAADASLEEANEALSEAKTALNKADAALKKAKKARAAAKKKAEEQRKAEEEAARKAEQEKKDAEEAAAAARAADSALANGSANSGSNVAGDSQDASITESATDDGVDWSEDKASFVAKWAPRIDAYLAGSELAGKGKTFASAAWDYGVDPRWSPAISCVESSKGAHCFKKCNAWGWGSSSWDNWDEAIRAHVSGLARIYGYTVSLSAAKKYCPPNWKHWYNRCVAEMKKI